MYHIFKSVCNEDDEADGFDEQFWMTSSNQRKPNYFRVLLLFYFSS